MSNAKINYRRCPVTNKIIPEIWEPIIGYAGYEVSNYGRVISYKRSNPKLLEPYWGTRNYLAVGLYNDGYLKNYRIHRLVGEYFVPNLCDKPQINHLNENKQDNFFLNLEWCTASENKLHSVRMGTHNPPVGERSHTSVLTKNNVHQIRSVYNQGWATQTELADAYNCTQSNINRIINKDIWCHV